MGNKTNNAKGERSGEIACNHEVPRVAYIAYILLHQKDLALRQEKLALRQEKHDLREKKRLLLQQRSQAPSTQHGADIFDSTFAISASRIEIDEGGPHVPDSALELIKGKSESDSMYAEREEFERTRPQTVARQKCSARLRGRVRKKGRFGI